MKYGLLPRALFLSVCMLVCAVALTQASKSEPTPLRLPLSQLPNDFEGWQGARAADLDANVLKQLAVDEYLNRVYRADSSRLPVGLYIGYYKSQRQGETMHSPLNCLPGSGWQPVSNRHLDVPLTPDESASTGSPSPLVINRYVVQKGTDNLLVLYWYQSHGRVVASEYWGKFYTVVDAIRLNRTDAALIRVTVPVLSGVPNAEADSEAAGIEFVHKMFPHLVRHLPI